MFLVEELKKKTVFELKAYAKQNNIDLFGTKTKNEILETIFNFLPLEAFSDKYKKVEEEEKVKKTKEAVEKRIAVYSERNLHWVDVGSLETGYNIVTEEESEKWLTHKAVRLATPEEVASFYGKA